MHLIWLYERLKNIKMKKKILLGYGLIVFLAALPFQMNHGQVTVDLESGYVTTGYNDIRSPGDLGTMFSLNEELEAKGKVYYRLRLNYNFNDRNTVSVLYAPLTVSSHGSIPRDVLFEDAFFTSGSPIDASYKFNSYRITYRYKLVQKEKFEFGLGFTAKIRDAKVALESGNIYAEKVNVGFVPIINFRLAWYPEDKIGLLLEGDALAAPQGRAEDVLAAVTYKASDKIGIKVGYRILEGGADNDEVYTFSLFHYAAAGLFLTF